MSQVVIENVGAIRHVEIPVAPGSVTVLEGRNGAGKTTALKAIEAAVTGKNTGLTPSDGKKAGSIDFAGVHCRIGLRFSAKGELAEPVVYIDSGESVRTFINPGIKNPEAADRRRIEAMIELTGAKCSPEELREFIDPKILDEMPTAEQKKLMANQSLVDQVASIKQLLEDRARVSEARVQQITGQLQQLPAESGNAIERDLGELKADLELTTGRYLEAKKKAEASAAAARELGQFERVDLEPISNRLLSLRSDSEGQQKTIRAMEQAALETHRLIDALTAQYEAHKSSNQRIDVLQQALEAGGAPEGVETLRHEKERITEQLQESLAHNASVKQAAEKRDERLGLLRDRDILEAQATELRKKARGSYKLLADAVSQFDGWSVSEEMRLCCEHARGLIHFAELSPGEQAIRALDLATHRSAPGAPGVTVVPQEIWESLDGASRQLVQQWAAERQIAVITAQCQQQLECPACLLTVPPGTEQCPGCDHRFVNEPLTAKTYGGAR